MTIAKCARAFIEGRSKACHNSSTDGKLYLLHGHRIAERHAHGITFYWCDWYTVTTANHINHILIAMDAKFRVSYATDRDLGINTFEALLGERTLPSNDPKVT